MATAHIEPCDVETNGGDCSCAQTWKERYEDALRRATGHAYASAMAEGGEEIQHQELTYERRQHAQTRAALKAARRAVVRSAMTGPSPIGPLHGAGWNDAVLACVNAFDVAVDSAESESVEQEKT